MKQKIIKSTLIAITSVIVVMACLYVKAMPAYTDINEVSHEVVNENNKTDKKDYNILDKKTEKSTVDNQERSSTNICETSKEFKTKQAPSSEQDIKTGVEQEVNMISEPTTDPVPEPTVEPTPEITPEPIIEPTPEPTPEPLTGIEYYKSIEDISWRFIVPDIGLDVGLYQASGYDPAGSQAITDAVDSAAYLDDFTGRIIIADHCYQAFGNLYDASVGMHAWIYGQEYVVTEAAWGTNEKYTLRVNGIDLTGVYDGQITAYTCSSTNDMYNVWTVTMAPV